MAEESKYSQSARTYQRYMKLMTLQKKDAAEKKYPPRAKGSERSYTFKGPQGTRYSGNKQPKKGERRMD